MRTSPFSKRTSPDSLWINLAPFPVLVAVLLFEYLFPTTRITSALLFITLGGFSLILKPRSILYWTLVFSIPVVWNHLEVAGALSIPPGATALRILSFLSGGVIAMLLSSYRIRLSSEINNLLRVFDALPVALVISDMDGEIQFVNDACCQFLDIPAEEVVSSTYFSLFSDPANRGREIERYLTLFEEENSMIRVVLVVQSARGALQKQATCFVVNIRSKPYLVTQITETY